ncbi:hypothetical protein [Flavobacterium oreochromis]|uniref:hypothetical protein n=1 Tax=Flavobacterium oreochromis TaxID=2906078 RepID=UPI00385B4877
MRKILIVMLLFSLKMIGQYDGQDFCKGYEQGSYFPLDIKVKKMTWYNTYYLEKLKGTKEINGKVYKEFEQIWEKDGTDLLYLREENNIIYEYNEEKKAEFIRLDKDFKLENEWNGNDEVYKIISLEGNLVTPFCMYKNLLVIESKGKKVTYRFYYLKGLGYVGATRDGKLVSYIKPEIK